MTTTHSNLSVSTLQSFWKLEINTIKRTTMKSFTLTSPFYIPTHSNLTSKHRSPSLSLKNTIPTSQNPKSPPKSKSKLSCKPLVFGSEKVFKKSSSAQESFTDQDDGLMAKISPSTKMKEPLPYGRGSRYVMVGAVSLGLMMLLMGWEDPQKALAFGPEGPLMEDFWDNMRRYGLYALTVSSGVLYAVFQPLYELLKNPISAILILIILGGGFYIVSQVVSAMVGITEFSYDYNY